MLLHIRDTGGITFMYFISALGLLFLTNYISSRFSFYHSISIAWRRLNFVMLVNIYTHKHLLIYSCLHLRTIRKWYLCMDHISTTLVEFWKLLSEVPSHIHSGFLGSDGSFSDTFSWPCHCLRQDRCWRVRWFTCRSRTRACSISARSCIHHLYLIPYS